MTKLAHLSAMQLPNALEPDFPTASFLRLHRMLRGKLQLRCFPCANESQKLLSPEVASPHCQVNNQWIFNFSSLVPARNASCDCEFGYKVQPSLPRHPLHLMRLVFLRAQIAHSSVSW
jgi:hypothetical protein